MARKNTLEIVISAKDRATSVISGVMKSTGKSMMLAGGVMTLAAAPLIAGFKSAATAAASFENQLDNIQSILGSTDAETKVLTQDLLAFGAAALAGPEGVAVAFEEIAGGVEDASTHMAILEQSIKTAEAGQADLLGTTSAMVSVMNSYALSAADAAMVSDVLTRTVGMGVGSMEQFAGAFPAVTGLAASLGVSFQDIGTAAAFMTTKGFTASQATNQLKAMMVSMLNPNAKMAESLAEIGLESGTAAIEQLGLVGAFQKLNSESSSFQANMAGNVGSVEALNGVIALTDASYNDFAETFAGGVPGATAAAQAIQLGNFEAQMGLLNSSLKALKITIGLALLPMLTALVQRIQPIVTSLVKWASENSGVIETVAKIVAGVAALGAALTAVGAAFAFAPLTTLAAGLLAVAVALGVDLKGGLKGLIDPLMSVVNFISILVSNFGTLYDVVKKFGLDSPVFFGHLWKFFGEKRARQIKKFIDTVGDALETLAFITKPVTSAIGKAFGSIIDKIDSIIETFNILSYVGKKFGVESRLFFQYLEIVFGSQYAGRIQGFAVSVKNALSSVVSGFGNLIDMIRVLWDVGKTFGFDSKIFFQYLERAVGPQIIGGIQAFVDGFRDALGIIKDVTNMVGNFIGDIISAFQTGGLEAVGQLILDKIVAGLGVVKDWAVEHILDPIIAGIKGGAIGDVGSAILDALKPPAAAIGKWVNENILAPISKALSGIDWGAIPGQLKTLLEALLVMSKPIADVAMEKIVDPIVAWASDIDWSAVAGSLENLLNFIIKMDKSFWSYMTQNIYFPVIEAIGKFAWGGIPGALDLIMAALLTGTKKFSEWVDKKIVQPLIIGLGDSSAIQSISTGSGQLTAAIFVGLGKGLGDVATWTKRNTVQKIVDVLKGGSEDAKGGGLSLGEDILLGLGTPFLSTGEWSTTNIIAPFMRGLTGKDSMAEMRAGGIRLGLEILVGILKAPGDLLEWIVNKVIKPLGNAITEKSDVIVAYAVVLGLSIYQGILDGLVGIGQAIWDAIKSEIGSFDFGSLLPDINFPGIPGLAAGGAVAASTPYVVGEKGPELFVPQSAGRIVPHGQLMRGGSSSGAGGGDGTYISLDGANLVLPGVTNARQFFDELEREATRRNRQFAPMHTGLNPARGGN